MSKPKFVPSDSILPRSINQSPEQSPEQLSEQSPGKTFGVPLFPNYVGITPATQLPIPAQWATEATSATQSRNHSTENLSKQYAELSHLVQEQSEMHRKQSQILQQQMRAQAARHQSEMSQLEQAWSHRLDTVVANSQAAAPPVDRTAQPINSARPQSIKQPLPLAHVSTTYRVPHRARSPWVERVLGAVPTLVGLIVLGTTIAAFSAIALSPDVLWPSLRLIIQSFIPFVFVTGLAGIGITAVWDAAR